MLNHAEPWGNWITEVGVMMSARLNKPCTTALSLTLLSKYPPVFYTAKPMHIGRSVGQWSFEQNWPTTLKTTI